MSSCPPAPCFPETISHPPPEIQAPRGKTHESEQAAFLFPSASNRELGPASLSAVGEQVDPLDPSHRIRTVPVTRELQLVQARLIEALDSFQKGGREHSRSIESERGICRTPRGEVGGQCLILIKRARLIVSGNPVCHGRYAEESLWHRPTYGPACCSPAQPPQHRLSTVGPVPRALCARGRGLGPLFRRTPLSTNRPPHLQACQDC